MSILVDKKTRLVVQGITGGEGSFHTQQMVEYGTKVVAGVTPGKGGTDFEGIPVYNTVEEAVKEKKANTSVIFVPPAFAADAILEAANSGVKVIICITEGIPAGDMLKVYNSIKNKGVVLVGPNCPGVISPGKAKVGIYAVTESGIAGYQASFSADCSGTIAVGETRTCVVTNNDIPYGLITNSELCQFNVGAPDQFLLNFKNDKGNSYTLNASNPGQFYYNVVNGNQAGAVTMTIPYPFVTSGATPIHVYTADNFQWDDASQCFIPGTAAAGYTTPQITLSSTYPYTVNIENVPAGAYVNIHLDYGLKGTSQWTKAGNDAHKGNEVIQDGQTYTFDDGTNQQTTSSTNRFN